MGSLSIQTISIDQCYCEQKSFAQLCKIAHDESLSLYALAQREGCGTHCSWCVAYLRRALNTGQLVFHELLPKETIEDFHN